MKKLIILGAGQYGCVVKETAQAIGCFEKIDFLDDKSPLAVGKLLDYELFAQDYDYAFVAMGNANLRLCWLDKLEQAGYGLPVLVHPRAYVSPTAVLGKATIVEPMAVVNTGAIVEMGGLICAGAVVNHNSVVHKCCQIDCNAVVPANAVVPQETKVPSGTVFERE